MARRKKKYASVEEAKKRYEQKYQYIGFRLRVEEYENLKQLAASVEKDCANYVRDIIREKLQQNSDIFQNNIAQIADGE